MKSRVLSWLLTLSVAIVPTLNSPGAIVQEAGPGEGLVILTRWPGFRDD
jgi:hypothetical protein